MTLAELYSAWQRYAHRTDIAADLDLTKELADIRIKQAFLLPAAAIDLDAILISNADLYLHAGLIELAELAQDDEAGGREASLFNKSVSDYSFAYSLANSSGNPKSQYINVMNGTGVTDGT